MKAITLIKGRARKNQHPWSGARGLGRAAATLVAGLLLSAFPAMGSVLEVPSEYPTIQAGIDAAIDGDIVNVAAGTYVEQLDIDKAITLQGIDKDNTVIQSPAALDVKLTVGPTDYRPIIYVHDIDGFTIQDLAIDGNGQGGGNAYFLGLAVHEAGGTVTAVGVYGLHETPFSAAAHGSGLYALSQSGVLHSLMVSSSVFKACQQNGIELVGQDLSAVVQENMIIGPGEANGLTPPNGIRVADGALASIEQNEINQHLSSCATCGPDPITEMQSAAVRLHEADSGCVMDDNLITENDVGIYAYGSSQIGASFLLDNRYAGVILKGGTHDVGGSNFQGNHRVGIWVLGEQATDSAVLHDLCINGPGGSISDPTIVGVRAYSAGVPLSVGLRNCTINQWSIGIQPEGALTRLDVNDTSISSNWIAGYDNTASGAEQNAEYNWWGAADGPSPVGSGEIILGPAVDSDPILIEEYDTHVTCGLQRRGNEVGPQSPSECVSIDNPCVEDIPFAITRSDAAHMRGFTVTFSLSTEIDLCDGLNSIAEGTYLNGIGNTHFEKHNDGGGFYTVDCAILGLPCGATASSGTLFTIDVKKASGQPDGTGTIAMSAVTLRDCDNLPIAADMGSAATVTVDTQPPAAVADLAASQVKTGNDTDGTTEITLSFTAPGDANVVEVYRAPFGYYPEYDDDGGVAPTAPSYPPGSPWTLTSVTATGQNDNPPQRDFWYYVVFTQDACGNWSAVSNRTGGTLNYHLGDVTDGSPGSGDNDVGTDDISTLSSTYFKVDGEGGYLNYCDVGPTTDYSVDARPTTDNAIGFEDLMVFGINFGQVSFQGEGKHASVTDAGIGEHPELVLTVDGQQVKPGEILTARLLLEGNEVAVKGLHSVIAYEARELELLDVVWGGLLSDHGPGIFCRHMSGEGTVVLDAAVLGHGLTLHGSGEVAILQFLAHGADALPSLDVADLRGVNNRFLNLVAEPVTVKPVPGGDEITQPLRTEFLGVRPNPFLGTTEIVFSLATETAVSLRIYDASGRLVRTLADGAMAPGEHRVAWNGRLNSGGRASVGVYMCTFRAGEAEQSTKLFHYR